MSTRLAEPQKATISSGIMCDCCGQPLVGGFYYLQNRAGRFCGRCMTERERCASCGIPVCTQGWRLHDGRLYCVLCNEQAVYDVAQAREIFDFTVRSLREHPGLELRVGAEFRVVDQPELTRLAHEGGIASGEHEVALGLYQRHGRYRVVYVLYGLPKLLLRTVVAHELAHVWQGEHCPLLKDPLWREGFAEWAAYHHLRHIGATKAAERMLTAQHPYVTGLRSCLELERRVGLAGVLNQLRRQE